MVDVLAVSNSEVPTSKYEVLMAQPPDIYVTPLTEFKITMKNK